MIKEKKMAKDLGKIIQIVGVVVDVEFPRDVELPAIYDALHVKNGKETLVLEVAQHLDEHTVRAIALSSTDGLSRGAEVVATGAPISVPVGAETQGRMFNVVGEAIDEKPQPKMKDSDVSERLLSSYKEYLKDSEIGRVIAEEYKRRSDKNKVK